MKSRIALLAVALAFGFQRPAAADVQVGVGIALPGVRIGVNIPAYPDLVPITGYPVYYAPYLDLNLFFYDGLYWVFVDNNWYSSSWYDGPWTLVGPDYVPYFILRVPILYYRAPPIYFRDWDRRRPPRWDQHWGNRWREQHRDWDRWNRSAVPPLAPRPVYQRHYSGPRYPGVTEQRNLENRFYRYSPQERREIRQRSPGAAPTPRRETPRRQPGFGQPAPQQQSPGRQRYQRPAERGPAGPQSQAPRSQPRPEAAPRRQAPIYRAPPQGPRPKAQEQRRERESPGNRPPQLR